MSITVSPWITRFATRGGLLLYHDLTGRTCRLAQEEIDAFLAPDPANEQASIYLSRGFWVQESRSVEETIGSLYPVHCRWATFVAAPGQPPILARYDFEASAWVPEVLSGISGLVWMNAQGSITVAQMLSSLEQRMGPEAREEALEAILGLTHGTCQLLKLVDRPLSDQSPPPAHVFSLATHYRLAATWEAGVDVDLTAYHQEVIHDADEQFDTRETTLSHLLRYPTPILDDRAFGGALADALSDHLKEGAKVLEIGGGTGWVAQRVLERTGPLDYTIVDLSPALSAAQAKRLDAHGLSAQCRVGSALNLPIEDASIDVIINNEMIADLEASLVTPDAPSDLITRLNVVPDAPRITNVGALAFLEEIYRVLKPGGVAYVMEYGDVDDAPTEARHLDHGEVGIEWGVLERAAQKIGFSQVQLMTIDELIPFSDDPVLCVPQQPFEALKALVGALGGEDLEKRAYTPEELAKRIGPVPLECFHYLDFSPANERVMSFPLARMWLLMLTR